MQGCYAALLTLAQTPTAEHIDERFDTYHQEIRHCNVGLRQTLFTQKGREIDNIRSTKDALRQHVLRTGYQAGHVWGQVLPKAPQLPSPEFGWKRENVSSQ